MSKKVSQRIRPNKFNHNPANHKKLRHRWRSWLPTMQADIKDLLAKREIFWELQDISKNNPEILSPGYFFDWMCRNYMVAVTIGVRRFTDHRSDSRSLWRMLYEILENPKVINRRAFKALYRDVQDGSIFAERDFNRAVGTGKDALSQTKIRADLKTLEDKERKIRRLVNKRIAHFANPGAIRSFPIFDELDDALDIIDRTLCKYLLLLKAHGSRQKEDGHPTNYEPNIIKNWKNVLQFRWID